MKQLDKPISDSVLLTVLCGSVCVCACPHLRSLPAWGISVAVAIQLFTSSELASNSYCHHRSTAPLSSCTFNELHCGINWRLCPPVYLALSVAVMYYRTAALTNVLELFSRLRRTTTLWRHPSKSLPTRNLRSSYLIPSDKTSEDETASLNMQQSLTPWSTVSQLVNKFPAFYEKQSFFTFFTKARHSCIF